MKRTPIILISGGALVLVGAWSLGHGLARPARADELTAERAHRLESPGGAECYRWTYPKKAVCAGLSGTTECKTRPSIESSDDEKKKEQCEPAKGDVCMCD